MISAEASTHIKLDKKGIAWIDDSNVKVVEVLVDHLTYGHSPEEVHLQHPHLSLAQVYSAFAYYYDHQKELDDEMQQRYRRVQNLRSKTAQPLSRRKLLARLKRA